MFDLEKGTPPVAEGDVYSVEIEDIADEGDGVAKISGFVVFVPETTVGDQVDIRIKEVMPNFAVAETV